MNNLPTSKTTSKQAEPSFDVDDEFGDMKPAPTNAAMAKLTALVEEREKVIVFLTKYEDLVERGKKKLRDLEETDIPEVMLECGQTECTLVGGIKVKIKEDLFASIPSQSTIEKLKDDEAKFEMQNRLDQAMAWIETNCPDIVKRKFEIAFGRDDQKLADKFERDLAQRKKPVPVIRSETVHPMTLNATVRELIAAGHQVPWDLLGVYPKRVAKISQKR